MTACWCLQGVSNCSLCKAFLAGWQTPRCCTMLLAASLLLQTWPFANNTSWDVVKRVLQLLLLWCAHVVHPDILQPPGLHSSST